LSTEIGHYYSNTEQFLNMIQRSDADITKPFVESKDAREIGSWLKPTTLPLSWQLVREDHSTNSINLILRTSRKSLLVLNEYFRDEWYVTLNGHGQKSFRVNLNQIAVLLPEGTNEVHFEYRPRLFIYLLYIQRATAGVLAAGLLGIPFLRRRWRNKKDYLCRQQ
jgi:hypothetical protein